MDKWTKGAAYVSPSREQLYRGGGDELLNAIGSGVPRDLIPDDIMCIWRPGDEIQRVPRGNGDINTFINHGEAQLTYAAANPASVEWELPPPRVKAHVIDTPGIPDDYEPPSASLNPAMKIFTNAPDPDFLWTLEKDAAHKRTQRLKGRGWFYPTRYNEEPGYYEDELPGELKGKWKYQQLRAENNWWHKVGTDTWYKIPVDERHVGITPLAVRWVGELDA